MTPEKILSELLNNQGPSDLRTQAASLGHALDSHWTSVEMSRLEASSSQPGPESSSFGAGLFQYNPQDAVLRKLQMVSHILNWKFSLKNDTYWVECEDKTKIDTAIKALKDTGAMEVSRMQNKETKNPVILCKKLDIHKLLSFTTPVFEETLPDIFSDIFNGPSLHARPPEEADQYVRGLATRFLAPVRLPASENTDTVPDTPLNEALEALIVDAPTLKPFVTRCGERNYEAALRFAITQMSHQAHCVKLLDCLSKHVTLDINSMKDAKGRTPLHAAAIDKNYTLYYQMVSMGANSFITDNKGVSAGDYRRQNQSSALSKGENPLASMLSALGGDSEAMSPDCRTQ
jgi:hypothetical protein